jgi:hypothetical protein
VLEPDLVELEPQLKLVLVNELVTELERTESV